MRTYAGWMNPGGRELVSKRTRSEFRDICCDYSVVRAIERAYEDEGFASLSLGPEDPVWRGGARRGTFDTFANGIDWSDEREVPRALRVFEVMLSWTNVDNEFSQRTRDRVTSLLGRDGYDVTNEGRIISRRPRVLTSDLLIETLADPAALEGHLRRMESSADDDPALAISQSKALVEATAKLVLRELGEPFDEKADVPELAKAAQKALALHPDTIAPTAKGADISRKILGGLTAIAVGLAELRNLYGPDHGRSSATGPLKPRHAHLAIGASTTYCRAMLETLNARRASDDKEQDAS